ncbi:MAG: hypothetical protein KDK48_04945 [Chlamydiia bacterium]|nr:hypothetical protein [Chlamydiia bacterium]
MHVHTFSSFKITSSNPSLLFADGMKAKHLYLDLCNATQQYHNWISARNCCHPRQRDYAMAQADLASQAALKAHKAFSDFCKEKGIIRVEPNLSRR